MRYRTLAVTLCISAFVGCNKASESPASATVPSTEPAQKPGHYGSAITDNGEVVKIADVVAKPELFKGTTVVVQGEVRKACSKMGCWMEIADTATPDAPGARVTFKDYGFFIPVDSAGAHARVQGVLDIRTLTPDDVKHMEGEGAKITSKAADGSAQELSIVATGVELTKG